MARGDEGPEHLAKEEGMWLKRQRTVEVRWSGGQKAGDQLGVPYISDVGLRRTFRRGLLFLHGTHLQQNILRLSLIQSTNGGEICGDLKGFCDATSALGGFNASRNVFYTARFCNIYLPTSLYMKYLLYE